jgi:threonine synthase
MKYFSLNDKNHQVSFEQAVVNGLAPGNSLYFPAEIPQFGNDFFNSMPKQSLPEIAFHVLQPYVKDTLSDKALHEICTQVFDFQIPLVQVQDNMFALELFHGPTLAFKDIGARFLARSLEHMQTNKTIRVLVATSGDTGSAVANGFLGIEGTEVVVLYPKGKVSILQQKQFATLGQNIKPIAIDGTFDDCQRLVKTAFADESINKAMNLTSANSINVARWIPQSVYYYWAVAQVKNRTKKIVISVPSGNLGNISSGMLAQKTGLPVHHFIAASNMNNIVPQYLKTGQYEPKPSIQTIANAMDVGDPNNFPRLLKIFGNNFESISKQVSGFAYSDAQIKSLLKSCKEKNQYLLDPHGATAYGALADYQLDNDSVGIFLETAHPAKFREEVELIIGEKLILPKKLQEFDKRTIETDELGVDYKLFKAYLLNMATL